MNMEFCITVIAVSAVLMTGCTANNYPEMTDDTIAFEIGTFQDPKNDEELFGTLEYNGKKKVQHRIDLW